MTQVYDWQGEVGRKWARLHALTDRAFSGLTQILLDRLARLPGVAILDIGCGAGELSLALSRQRPQARIVGVDVSADLVAAALTRAEGRANPSFTLADAATWQPVDFTPDLLVSRHGVMFFPEPVVAFAHLREIAAPGAALAFSCFRDRRLNPWASELTALLPAHLAPVPDPIAPGPFAFADEARMARILDEAGWQDLACEPVEFAYVVGTGVNPLADARTFLGAIGPAAPALTQLQGTAAGALLDKRIDEWLAGYCARGMVAIPAAAWIVTARRD